MVVALGPGRFYGTSLPRPRYYTDVKLADHRVDPPVPVLDPFLSWAHEAHWSMGGLSFTRHRLQGRIEGNVNKLRAQRERSFKIRSKTKTKTKIKSKSKSKSPPIKTTPRSVSVSPPPAPIAAKRRRLISLRDQDDEAEIGSGSGSGSESGSRVNRNPARKLYDDFDRVANENVIKKSNRIEKKSIGGSVLAANRTKIRADKRGVDVDRVSKAETVKELVSVVRTSPRNSKRN